MVNREITLHPDERIPASGWGFNADWLLSKTLLQLAIALEVLHVEVSEATGWFLHWKVLD